MPNTPSNPRTLITPATDLSGVALLFAALYISELWYSVWVLDKRKLHAKARAMVVFDRAINLEETGGR